MTAGGASSPGLPPGPLQKADLASRAVLVLGLGISGRAVAEVLTGLGARVLASDAGTAAADHPQTRALTAAGAEVETGSHDRALSWLDEAELVIPSPGISPSAPVVAAALSRGVPVVSEIELAARLARAPIAAITGTNGKTTTASMLGEMIEAAGRQVVVCGNIGLPFISAVHDRPDADAFVVEVSSFQLTFCYEFHPQVAVITNLAPDHIDWHGTMDAYRDAKARIAARQTQDDAFVYPAAQSELAGLAPAPGPRRVAFSAGPMQEGHGTWLHGEVAMARIAGGPAHEVGNVAALRARGGFFVEDALAAAAAARCLDVPPEAVRRVVEGFSPDHHRVERVGEIDGVAYVDDSKATNPHATLAALASIRDVVLICGGRSRSGDLSSLRDGAASLRAAVTIGEAGPELASILSSAGVRTVAAGSMDEAVAAARDLAVRGSTVLLSPACASLDQFEDYKHRGRAFREAVEALTAREAAR